MYRKTWLYVFCKAEHTTCITQETLLSPILAYNAYNYIHNTVYKIRYILLDILIFNLYVTFHIPTVDYNFIKVLILAILQSIE